jgi:hypothetical protein
MQRLSTVVWFTVIVFVFEMFIVSFLISRDHQMDILQNERDKVVYYTGSENENKLFESALNTYDVLFLQSGIMESSINLFVPTNRQKQASTGLENLGDDMFPTALASMNALWDSVFQLIYRTTLMLYWLPFIFPFFLAGIFDGFMTRNIKKHTYGYASPVRYHMSMHIIRISFILIPLLLFAPFTISPLVILVWALLQSIAFVNAARNLQKKL